MIERYGWDSLPESVRQAVKGRLGDVTVIRDVAQGQSCNVALVVHEGRERVFLKGVKGVSPRMRWLRNEAEAGDLAPGLAPAIRFAEDVEPDWFVVGFEYVDGRAADLSPGSHDLATVAETAEQIAAFPGGDAPPLSERWKLSDWWSKTAEAAPDRVAGWDIDDMTKWSSQAAGAVDGTSLLHTDLHEHQLLIDDEAGQVRVIDWGRPASGAAWVDTAFLVIRLIAAGHHPRDAQAWARSLRTWSTATDEAVTAFACYVAGLWAFRAATSPFPGASGLSLAANTFARHRLSS